MSRNTDGIQNDVTVESGFAVKKNKHKTFKGKQVVLPVLFEGSANSWWNPKFDSDCMENLLQKCLVPLTRCRFRWALIYVAISCLVWCIFFATMITSHMIAFGGVLVLLIIVLSVLGFSYLKVFDGLIFHVSIFVILLLLFANLLSFVSSFPSLSKVGTFISSVEILILLYTFFTLPLYICTAIGVLYSVTFELLSGFLADTDAPAYYIISRILLHIVVHVVGIHIYIMSQVRKRSTFLKICQSVCLRKDLEFEKQLKRCMINSLMPPKVAEEIMKSRDYERDRETNDGDDDASQRSRRRHNSLERERGIMTFRHFHMSQMDNVSILFADIVGFTKMSSKKTAEHLVFLLSDLFGRFDKICVECDCEKISTLGDCYYCVSGCPEPREDHAKCCVEMGLKMCAAIKQFDQDHKEEVNMRVGVHTGTVLCGLVGTRRFKFDVWSHDVTLANIMESEGKAGLVHISDCTYHFVKDDYFVEEGVSVPDIRKHQLLTEFFDSKTQQFIVQHVHEAEQTIRTWFIIGCKSDTDQSYIQNQQSLLKEISANSQDSTNCSDCAPSDIEQDGIALQETVGGTANEYAKLDHTKMSAVQLMGKRENSLYEDTDRNTKSNGSVVAHLLGTKKQEVDKELIERIFKQTENYLYHPAINHCTVRFRSNKLEQQYHRYYAESACDSFSTCASPLLSSLFDMLVSFVIFLIISFSCFLSFGPQLPLVIVFVILLVLQFLLITPMLLNVFKMKGRNGWLQKVCQFFARWYPQHFFGGFLASLPTLTVYSAFYCEIITSKFPCLTYCLLVITSFIHFCNFTLLSSWMKSCLAIASGIVLVLEIQICNDCPTEHHKNSSDYLVSTCRQTINEYNRTAADNLFCGCPEPLFFKVIVDIILLLLLICFLNREIEISYRISYHVDIEAIKDRRKMQIEEEQADWLLHNIVPKHVAEHLKQNKKYSKTHKDIGVIFAKIVNFEDFYDESFEGGKEYLRVLNELMGDFEELFDDPKYHDVEKIKTIGSCLMAASGLNPKSENEDPDAHLCALMNFSYELLHKLEQFNNEIFNFDFEMSIGYNFGEVTAGVVGTTKLLYDIWGDTVNIASRMYSTGVHGRIQVTEDTAIRLKDYFDFEPRGQVSVKGKGDMNVFLLAEKRRQIQ